MTHETTTDRPIWFTHDEADFDRARAMLADAGFAPGAVLEAVGLDSITEMRTTSRDQLGERLAGGGQLALLIRLFLMGDALDDDQLRTALAPMDPAVWCASGLLEPFGSGTRAAVQLLPYDELLLAVDFARTGPGGMDMAADYVMGVGGSTRTLATLTIRRPGGAMLDLGTGCGVHALIAAAHADTVTATDINPRAVAFTQFNARLNGITNLRALEGSFFEPVAGERFDLIISNPPFVISPERSYIYRDSDLPADEVVAMMVRTGAQHLAEDGICQMLCNWARVGDEPWTDRLEGWFAGTGCDAWIHETTSATAEEYAKTWIRHTERDDPEQYAQRLARWVSYYDQQGITGVHGGLITFRKRTPTQTPNWFRVDGVRDQWTTRGPGGDHMLRLFEAAGYLQTTRPEAMMSHCLVAAPDVRLGHESKPVDGGWTIDRSTIRLDGGVATVGTLDVPMSQLVMGCDGATTLGTLTHQLADNLGEPIEVVASSVVGIVRSLIEQGFLLPPSP